MSETTGLLGRDQEPVHRYLSTSTVSMLAIGGTIGTGLFFSVASLIVKGPLMALVAMCYIAFIVVIVLEVTAELAVFFPGGKLMCQFQFLFLGRPVGLANSVIYWLSWGLTYALELSIATSICGFWNTSFVANHLTFIVLAIWLTLTGFNLLPVDIYGKIEFWISLIKVVAIVAWIGVVGSCLVLSGGGFQVWLRKWPVSFLGPVSSWPRIVISFVNCLIFLSFIFQSVESIAITTGDLAQPHVTIPKVTKIIYVRIVVFYLVSVFLLTLLVPYEDQGLKDPQINNLLSSPFLMAMINCGFSSTGPLLLTFNVIILSAIVSAANSNVYFGLRFLEAMVETHGPNSYWRFLALKNSQNVPVNAVLLTSCLGLMALLLKFQSIATLFLFLLTCCALAGMLMWLLLCGSHIRFSQALKSQGRTRQDLQYCLKWRLEYWAWFALINLALVLCLNGLTNYWDFSWTALIGSYMTPLAFVGLWLCFGGYNDIFHGVGLVPVNSINLDAGDFKSFSQL